MSEVKTWRTVTSTANVASAFYSASESSGMSLPFFSQNSALRSHTLLALWPGWATWQLPRASTLKMQQFCTAPAYRSIHFPPWTNHSWRGPFHWVHCCHPLCNLKLFNWTVLQTLQLSSRTKKNILNCPLYVNWSSRFPAMSCCGIRESTKQSAIKEFISTMPRCGLWGFF